MAQAKQFLQAKGYAYKLLSYRPRSTKEIKERLKRKGFALKIIEDTIEYLSQLNYLNDEEFARFWVQTKMRTAPLGRSLLKFQLRQKGLAEETVDTALSDIAGQYDENEMAKQVVASRRKRYKGLAPLKQKRRLYDYLRRRGFSHEAIREAVNMLQEVT